MASLHALETPRLLTAEEFFQIDFGPDLKAELDNGVIRMMAGGTRAHAQAQGNILSALMMRLRGSGCYPYGPDMAVNTHGMSVRYPDVTVDCGKSDDRAEDLAVSNPRAVFEVLSPSTRDLDLRIKKEEYRAIGSVDTIVFVDPDAKTVSVSQRIETGWVESSFDRLDVALPSLGVTIPYAEIFGSN